MASFRSARLAAVAALIGGTIGPAQGQTVNHEEPRTPAEMAAAIAHTIEANTLKAPGAAITFESATSHDNFVEMRYVANDAAIISRLKSNADQVRLNKASYYCNESRIAYLKLGVVMHEVIATSDNSDQLDFTFDISSCDNLPKSKPADSKTLAELALTVAKTENDSLREPSKSPLRLKGATAHEGTVDERFVVLDASARAGTQANRGNITGVFKGYFCSKYRDAISQGVVIHHFFALPDDSPVFDFTIDRSTC
jgi:hypothetical protein